MKDERDFSFPLQTFPLRSFWFCKRRVARMCCLRPGTVRVFRNTALMTSCNSTKEKKILRRTLGFCFVFGSYPMASKNTQALSLLALPEVRTNLTGSWLIEGSLRRADEGLPPPGQTWAFGERLCVIIKQ